MYMQSQQNNQQYSKFVIIRNLFLFYIQILCMYTELRQCRFFYVLMYKTP